MSNTKVVSDTKTGSNSKAIPNANNKILWIIAGGVLGLILLFFIGKSLFSNKHHDNAVQVSEIIVDKKEDIHKEEPIKSDSVIIPVSDLTTSKVVETPPKVSDPPKQTTTSPASTPAVSTDWIANYDRYLNLAQAAYNSKNFTKARDEYTKALNLARQNGDNQKVSFVNGQIAQCKIGIEEANKAKEAETQARLAFYNFVGKFPLGSAYMVVQSKSDNNWGIVRLDGTQAEAFIYKQSFAAVLRNGCRALKNDNGWVVFDTSLNKVATNISIEKLEEYK
jgi:tetratricopeptide (TPR) repeat protein